MSLFWCFQSYNGDQIEKGKWVAVAYDEAYYVGQVTAIMSEEEMEINFLAQSHDGVFKWPRKKDCAKIDKKYIFSCNLQLETVGEQFTLKNLDKIEELYENYKKRFMH